MEFSNIPCQLFNSCRFPAKFGAHFLDGGRGTRCSVLSLRKVGKWLTTVFATEIMKNVSLITSKQLPGMVIAPASSETVPNASYRLCFLDAFG